MSGSPNYNIDRKVSLFSEPLPQSVLYPEKHGTVIVMVGLPARGKSFISTKLARYLNWIGIKTKVFNVGVYRRKVALTVDHDFFRGDNEKATELRNKVATEALTDLADWMMSGGRIGLFDATNTTRARRDYLIDECTEMGFNILFVESVCDDQDIIKENILDVKVNNPDYKGQNTVNAVQDFMERIKHYEEVYEPIDDKIDARLSFVRIINQGQRYVANMIKGNVQCRIVYYLMNMSVTKRTIYLTRHGESMYNVEKRIGGNSTLTEHGQNYAQALEEFMMKESVSDLQVWTSHMRRAVQTSDSFKNQKLERWKALNEMNAGVCEGMTYEEIEDKYPHDCKRRQHDKYHYRYPMGESYEDLVNRLEPVIMEMERHTNILIISHQAVLRCLLAFFTDVEKDMLPCLDIPLHAVIRIKPTAYTCDVDYFTLDVPSVKSFG